MELGSCPAAERRYWRVMKSLSLALVGLAVVLATGVPASAVTTTELKSKALSLTNMPTGWSLHPPVGSAAANTRCLKLFKAPFPHEVQTTVLFEDGNLPALEEALQSGSGLDVRYRKLKSALTACRGFSFTASGKTFHGTARSMSFPTFGDRSGAFALTFTDQGVRVGADVVLFKVGAIIGEVLYEALGTPDTNELQAFMTEAVNKIEGKPTVAPAS
jgi:hypothetical protein